MRTYDRYLHHYAIEYTYPRRITDQSGELTGYDHLRPTLAQEELHIIAPFMYGKETVEAYFGVKYNAHDQKLRSVTKLSEPIPIDAEVFGARGS